MANVNAYVQTFSGGELGDAMVARVGVDAYQAASQLVENWFMQAQGPMSRRPSLAFIAAFADASKKQIIKKFEFDVGQNYLLTLEDFKIRFFINDAQLTTDAITATISNGSF